MFTGSISTCHKSLALGAEGINEVTTRAHSSLGAGEKRLSPATPLEWKLSNLNCLRLTERADGWRVLSAWLFGRVKPLAP